MTNYTDEQSYQEHSILKAVVFPALKRVIIISITIITLIIYGGVLHSEEPFSADIYLQNTNQLVFRQYNSRVVKDNEEILKHIYTFPDGSPKLHETVIKRNGAFSEYRVKFFDSGCECGIIRQKKLIKFRFKKEDKVKRGVSEYKSDLVMGPTLSDFIQSNWDKLVRGDVVYFLLPVMNLQRLATFKLKRLNESPSTREGSIVIEMGIANFFLGFLIDPVQMVYDATRKRVLEIHGPSLLDRKVNGERVNIDVDIYYRYKNDNN
jgi:hypothetical protein